MPVPRSVPTLIRVSGCLLAYVLPFVLLMRHRGPDPPLGIPFITLLSWLLSLAFAVSAFRCATAPHPPIPRFVRYLGRYVWAGPVLATLAFALHSALAPEPFDVSVLNATDEALEETIVTFDTGFTFHFGYLAPHARATYAFASNVVPTQVRLSWQDHAGASHAAQISTPGVLPNARRSSGPLVISISTSGITCMSPAFPERGRTSSSPVMR